MTRPRAGAVKRGRHGKEEGSRPERRSHAREAMRANRGGKRKNALTPRGPRKSLIRLNLDKEIQASPLVGFGRAWLDLAQFGPIWIPLGFFLDLIPYTSAPRTSSDCSSLSASPSAGESHASPFPPFRRAVRRARRPRFTEPGSRFTAQRFFAGIRVTGANSRASRLKLIRRTLRPQAKSF